MKNSLLGLSPRSGPKRGSRLTSPVTSTCPQPETPGPRQELICAFRKRADDRDGHWATTGCQRLGSWSSSTTRQGLLPANSPIDTIVNHKGVEVRALGGAAFSVCHTTTNSHRCSSLKTHRCVTPSLCRSAVLHGAAGLSVGILQVLQASPLRPGVLLCSACCWGTSITCSCRTEVPLFCYLAAGDHAQHLGAACIPSDVVVCWGFSQGVSVPIWRPAADAPSHENSLEL